VNTTTQINITENKILCHISDLLKKVKYGKRE